MNENEAKQFNALREMAYLVIKDLRNPLYNSQLDFFVKTTVKSIYEITLINHGW